MKKKGTFRKIGGIILGGLAGLSLSSSVLPTILGTMAGQDSFYVRWMFGEYAAVSAAVWAVAGWTVARIGMLRVSAVLFSVVGLATGILLCVYGLGTESKLLLVSGAGGLGYGLIGGLLLGNVLRDRGDSMDVDIKG